MKFIAAIIGILITGNALGQTLPSNMQTSVKESRKAEVEAPKSQGRIHVNNRVLAVVNNSPISVVDLVKKMDFAFASQYPQYASSTLARFQYYTISWKTALEDLVDKELILADAQDMELEISHGDIRQEMQELFGPDIMASLDKAGLSYEEALEAVRSDLLFRRMMFGRINMKAMNKIGPKQVRLAYQEYTKQQTDTNQWVYNIISFRCSDTAQGAATAQEAYSLLAAGACSADTLASTLNNSNADNASVTIKISEQYRHEQRSTSPAYREALASIDAGSYSAPVAHKSRDGKETIYRIFHLVELIAETPPPLCEMENEIRRKLLEDAMVEESEKYFEELRRRFGVSKEIVYEMIPDSFEPFSMN